MKKFKLKHKYSIGTHVMFYEVEILPELVSSIIHAVKHIENPENITVDFLFNSSEFFEKIDLDKITLKDLFHKFYDQTDRLRKTGINVESHNYTLDKQPYTMTDYRREFNYKYCNEVDYLIWGETDCLIPRQTFEVLDSLKDYANSNGIYRYITTFATRKMWDDSWKPLEHPDFTDKPLLQRKINGVRNEEAYQKPYSISYTMSQEEMDEINAKTDQPDLLMLKHPKFDGSCLVISSDLVKAGANIPPGYFGLVGEDTAFMVSCMQIMGPAYKQFVVKNILKVHNREHPNKRKYTGESTQGNKGEWYQKIKQLNNQNLNNIGPKQDRFLTWGDYNKLIQ